MLDFEAFSPPEEVPFSQHLNEIEVQQIQMLCWDFFSAYKMGDRYRCGVILQIILDISKIRDELPTLQEYFQGKKITRYRNRISMKMAARYIAFVTSEVKRLVDWRIQSTPIE